MIAVMAQFGVPAHGGRWAAAAGGLLKAERPGDGFAVPPPSGVRWSRTTPRPVVDTTVPVSPRWSRTITPPAGGAAGGAAVAESLRWSRTTGPAAGGAAGADSPR